MGQEVVALCSIHGGAFGHKPVVFGRLFCPDAEAVEAVAEGAPSGIVLHFGVFH